MRYDPGRESFIEDDDAPIDRPLRAAWSRAEGEGATFEVEGGDGEVERHLPLDLAGRYFCAEDLAAAIAAAVGDDDAPVWGPTDGEWW